MKKKRVTAPKSTSASSKNLLKKQVSKRKKSKMSSLLVGTLVFIGFLLLITIQPTIQTLPIFETPTPTIPPPSPTPTPLIPSEDFAFYSQLSGEEKFAVAYNFTDPVLKVSFAYPPGYYMQAIKAEKNEPYVFANVFFAKNGNTDAIKGIQNVVDCELDNRKDPAGLCRESQMGDIEVSIRPYKEYAPDFVETEYCRREIREKERVLISCGGQMSIDARDRGMSYTLYLLGENPVAVSLSVRDPKTHAHIIRSILSSATNHAQ